MEVEVTKHKTDNWTLCVVDAIDMKRGVESSNV